MMTCAKCGHRTREDYVNTTGSCPKCQLYPFVEALPSPREIMERAVRDYYGDEDDPLEEILSLQFDFRTENTASEILDIIAEAVQADRNARARSLAIIISAARVWGDILEVDVIARLQDGSAKNSFQRQLDDINSAVVVLTPRKEQGNERGTVQDSPTT